MGFFNTLTRKAKQKIFQGYYSRQIAIPPMLNTQDYVKAYGQIGWLFAAVSKIAQNVGSTEWQAYNKAGDIVDKSMALEVLNHPNPFYSLYETLELTSMYLDLTGKCFWYLSKDRLGRVKEIWVISPLYMWIVPDFKDHIKGYMYQDGAQNVPLEPDEVIFFNFPNPDNPYGGVSPAQATANALESDKYAAQWNRNFFYNSAEPQGIITVQQGLTDDEYTRLKRQWQDKYGGVDNAKRTAILEGGATYQSIQMNQKDMDFTNLRNMNRDEILGVFGVPKSILGLTDAVNRANAETAEYTFAKHTVTPRIKRIQDKINNEFVPLFGEEIELRHTDIIPANKEFIVATLNSQVDKSMTKNEVRNILGKLLDVDLEDLVGGDVIYQPTTLQPMGTLPPGNMPVDAGNGQTALLSHPHPAVVDLQEQHRQEDKAEAQAQQAAQQALQQQAIQQQAQQAKGLEALNNLIKSIEENDKKIKKKLSAHYKSLDRKQYKEKWNEDIEKMVAKYKPVWKEIFNHQRDELLKSIESGHGKESPKFLDSVSEKDYMYKKVRPIIEDMFKYGGQRVFEEFGKSLGFGAVTKLMVGFDVHNPHTSKWIETSTLKHISYANATTKKLIQEKLSSDEYEGKSIPEIAASLGEYFNDMSEGRLERIARTEVVSSTNAGQLEGYKQSGVVDGKQWVATIGPRTREWHAEADGQEAGIYEPFMVDGEELEFPGDPNGSAENIINCRCCTIPTFND